MTAVVVLVASCGPPDESEASSQPPEPDELVHPDALWFDVLEVSPNAPDYGRVELAKDAEQLAVLWVESRFEGPIPEVPFDEQIVLVYWRPEDACPDELVEVRLTDGVLEATFLPPPGGCRQPLIPTAYAVALHRGDLPERFTVFIPQHEGHGGDVEVTFALPPYDGPPAPRPASPPRRPDQAEIDALFADSPLRRCEEMPDHRSQVEVDGPVSDDPEVAAAQEARVGMGLPSDEATVRQLLDDPEADRSFGFPMTRDEFEDVMARTRPDLHEALEGYRAESRDTYAFTAIDHPGGGVFVVGFTEDLDGHRQWLAERVPDAPIRVVEAPATEQQMEAAQEALFTVMGVDGPRVIGAGVGAGYLEVLVVDPTAEDLAAIAEVADSAFTCIKATFSGLPRE